MNVCVFSGGQDGVHLATDVCVLLGFSLAIKFNGKTATAPNAILVLPIGYPTYAMTIRGIFTDFFKTKNFGNTRLVGITQF